jgi:hypothetical protein
VSDTQSAKRLALFSQLLAQPDPLDLPPRGRRYVYAGDAKRRDIIKRDLARAWLSHQSRPTSCIVSVRRSRIQLVRST